MWGLTGFANFCRKSHPLIAAGGRCRGPRRRTGLGLRGWRMIPARQCGSRLVSDVSDVLVGKDGKMSPRNAGRFLQMLADREPVFETNLKKVKPAKGETQAEVEEYFREKYDRLKAFLRQAIDRKESVQCSL